jgi:hypothetical protein
VTTSIRRRYLDRVSDRPDVGELSGRTLIHDQSMKDLQTKDLGRLVCGSDIGTVDSHLTQVDLRMTPKGDVQSRCRRDLMLLYEQEGGSLANQDLEFSKQLSQKEAEVE